MRPTEPDYEEELYECFDCGERIDAPETRVCPDCGGELRHISRSRDL